MRTTLSGVYTSVTAAAALLVLLLLGAAGRRPSSAASSESGFTSDNFEENCGTSTSYATVAGRNTVWATTMPSWPTLVKTTSYFATIRTAPSTRLVIIPCRPTFRLRVWANSRPTRMEALPPPPPLVPSAAIQLRLRRQALGGGGHEDTKDESRWGRFTHEPLRLPDLFMARFLNTLMYLAVVITTDVISAIRFGRWRPRYYQRVRRNRLNQMRRMRFRWCRMNAVDAIMRIWDACVQLHHTLRVGQDDVSGPTCQMISNIQLTEYPATLSTFADVPTSEVIATTASARFSALVSIASISAPTSVLPDLSLLVSRGALPEASALNLRPPVSPLHLRLPEASEMSAVASCHPRASLPNIGLQIAPRPSVSPRSPLLLAAAPPTTGPTIALSQCLPEAADGKMTLRAERPLTAMCPSAIDATNECAVGTVDPLVRYNTAEPSVTTPVEEFGAGLADSADEKPPSPFFVNAPASSVRTVWRTQPSSCRTLTSSIIQLGGIRQRPPPLLRRRATCGTFCGEL